MSNPYQAPQPGAAPGPNWGPPAGQPYPGQPGAAPGTAPQGQPVPFPGPGQPLPPTPGPPRPRNRFRQRLISFLGVAVVIVVIVAIRAGVNAARHNDSSPASSTRSDGSVPSAEFEVGKCVKITKSTAAPSVDPQTGEAEPVTEYEPVECDDKNAYARITQVQPAGFMSGTPDCPEDTDKIIEYSRFAGLPTSTGCLRTLAAPHPGDAGGGGGVIRVGDCVQYANYGGSKEYACAESPTQSNSGKVVGVVATDSECPASTTVTFERTSGAKPIICVAEN